MFVEPVLSADIVLLQLGGNDANYRVLPERIRENLDYMIANFQQRGQLVVFMANKLRPKYGQNYRAEIENLFEEVAREYALLFEPFIYKPLIDFETLMPRAELVLEDGVHPNATGVRALVAHSIPLVEKQSDNDVQTEPNAPSIREFLTNLPARLSIGIAIFRSFGAQHGLVILLKRL